MKTLLYLIALTASPITAMQNITAIDKDLQELAANNSLNAAQLHARIIDNRNQLLALYSSLPEEALPRYDICLMRLCNLITNYTLTISGTTIIKELNARIEDLYAVRENYTTMNREQRIHFYRCRSLYTYCRDAVIKAAKSNPKALQEDTIQLVKTFDKLLNGIIYATDAIPIA